MIPTLPPAYREVLALCVVEKMTYGEAARIAEEPEGTIRSRLHRAKAMLAERLAPAGLEAANVVRPRRRRS